ncbi:MAG TPA: hypothetical protein ENJ35_05075 [Gammaproteobacteria bacterium]|nr:hypothetical protein [Gammaproteobacteria bacterium]
MDMLSQERLRQGLAALFVLGALYATVVGSLWFMADFIATSVYSPNLDEAQQVADFNDMAYISESLRSYRSRVGIEALIMAIALLALAVAVVNRDNVRKPIFIAGGVALVFESLLLSHGFALSFAVLFVLTVVALYLATELETPQEEVESGDTLSDDFVLEPDESVPDAAPELTDPLDEAPLIEPEAAELLEINDDKRLEPTVPVPQNETEEVIVVDHDESADTASVEALGLEIESDMNLDLEPDYQLARGADDEQDPLVLLSQADLGIEEEPTIETAADIEREVGVDVSLDLATTAEIKAFIGMPDDVIEGEASEVVEDEVEAAETATGQADAGEFEVEASQPAHSEEEKAEEAESTEFVEPEPESEPVILTAVAEDENVGKSLPKFDPEELAQQEMLLPPPRQKVWNLLDWSILAVIALSIIALIAFYR